MRLPRKSFRNFTLAVLIAAGGLVALFIGIITSVFTALFVTRLIIQVWFNWRKPKTLIV